MTTQVSQPARGRENEFDSPRHVYEPHRVGLPPLRPYVRELWRRREFAFELSRTEMRAQHLDTAFGQLWLILNPLLLAGVYFILVDILRGHRGQGFFAHLLVGIFAYHFVSGAIRQSVRAVTSGGRLILNTAFPRSLLVFASVITALKRFWPTLLIYIPVHFVSGLPVTVETLWVIPLVALLTLLCAGLCLFVAALQVYFRDLKNLLPYMLRIMLYASPVLYYAEEVPARYQWILGINPLASLLTAWSDVIHFGHAPRTWAILGGTAWAIVAFVAGALFFISREREFAVRL